MNERKAGIHSEPARRGRVGVMDAPPDTRCPYETLRGIATRLGGVMAAALPWADGRQAVDAVCRELFAAGKGAAIGPVNEESWAQLLASRGWRMVLTHQLKINTERQLLPAAGRTGLRTALGTT